MNTQYWDAVVFIPKRPVFFFGFGVMANYNSKNMKLKIQWNIHDQDSEIYEIECLDCDKDSVNKWFEIKISEFGVKPIRVNATDRIHCKVRVCDDDSRRTLYGYSGYKDNYKKIEGQEYDFDTDYS